MSARVCLDRGMGTKPVARVRLLDAIVAVAGRYGYSGTTVARVIREAGLSRATFYEHFPDRPACFLEAYRRLVERIDVYLAGAEGRPAAELLSDALIWAARDPSATRVLLIETLGGPAPVRAQRAEDLSRTSLRLRRLVGAEGTPLTERALVGGLSGVIAIRVFRGETSGLAPLRDDLVAWIESYRLPPGAGESPPDWTALGSALKLEPGLPPPLRSVLEEGRLPRGRGALPPSAVAERQRLRMLAAVAQLCRERGYSSFNVADLVSTAGVTREAFYKQFRGKQDALLAAQALGLEQSVSFTAGRFFNADVWPERVWNGLRATLSYISRQPDLVYVDLVESFAAGAGALRRSFENRMAYTLFLEDGFRQNAVAEVRPRILAEAIAGAIHELFRSETEAGRSELMLAQLPQATYLCLAPFLGPAEAIEFVRAKVREDQAGR